MKNCFKEINEPIKVKNVHIKINVPQRLLNESIDNLSALKSDTNAFRRLGVFTVDDLINGLNENRKFQGCGVKKMSKIKSLLFNYIIENMTEKELRAFILS